MVTTSRAIYAPGPVPTDDTRLREYIQTELNKISAAVNLSADGHVDMTHAAPAKPADGDIRYADGTTWDPGSGAGFYYYSSSESDWVPFATSGGRSDYGWRDLVGNISLRGVATDPAFKVFRNGIYTFVFEDLGAGTQQEIFLVFHVDHDYAPGTPIYLHIHTAVAAASPSGTARIGFEYTAAKGHDQQAFGATSTVYVEQAYDTQYQHMISEVDVSDVVPSTNLEPDTLILVRCFCNCNSANYTLGDDLFVLAVDCHYQCSAATSTKNKAPNFYT